MTKSIALYRPLSLHAGISAVREFNIRHFPSGNVRQLGNMINAMPFHTAQRVLRTTTLDKMDDFHGFERTSRLLNGNMDPLRTALHLRMLAMINPDSTKEIFSTIDEDNSWALSVRKYASDLDNYNRNSILHEVGTMISIIKGHSENYMDEINLKIGTLSAGIEILDKEIRNPEKTNQDSLRILRVTKALYSFYKNCGKILQQITHTCETFDEYSLDPDHGFVKEDYFRDIKGIDSARLWNYLAKIGIIDPEYGIIKSKFMALESSLNMKAGNNFKEHELLIYSILLKANTFKITIAWFLQRIKEIKLSLQEIVSGVNHLKEYLPFSIIEIENSIKTLKEILKRYNNFTIEEFLISGRSINGLEHFPDGIRIAADLFMERENPKETIKGIDKRQRERIEFPGGEYFIPEYKAFLNELLKRNLDYEIRNIIYGMNKSIFQPDLITHNNNRIN